jgi:hypothetical protein
MGSGPRPIARQITRRYPLYDGRAYSLCCSPAAPAHCSAFLRLDASMVDATLSEPVRNRLWSGHVCDLRLQVSYPICALRDQLPELDFDVGTHLIVSIHNASAATDAFQFVKSKFWLVMDHGVLRKNRVESHCCAQLERMKRGSLQLAVVASLSVHGAQVLNHEIKNVGVASHALKIIVPQRILVTCS